MDRPSRIALAELFRNSGRERISTILEVMTDSQYEELLQFVNTRAEYVIAQTSEFRTEIITKAGDAIRQYGSLLPIYTVMKASEALQEAVLDGDGGGEIPESDRLYGIELVMQLEKVLEASGASRHKS